MRPLRAIVANAGFSPEEVLAEIKHSGAGYGFDVIKREVVAVDRSKVLDSANVVQTVAYRSIFGAALLLTVDILIRHKKPETVLEP